MAELEPEGDGTGRVQLPAMTYQAAHHIVKTAEGKLGFVLRYVPDEWGDDDEVILWFADGKESGYIERSSLTQATPADAGHELLAQYWAEAQAKIAWRKVGAIAKSPARPGELGVITVMEGDGCDEGCSRLRFANGESRWVAEASMDQATASDAGYEALLRAQARWILDDPLCKAAWEGDAAAIERLAGEGASPDAIDDESSGYPAVGVAAVRGHTAALEALLRLGADPNALGRKRSTRTALMHAADSGHAECARLLLEAGADATLRSEGKTALELLAEEGGKKRYYESDEEFAARQKGYTEVVALLVERLSP